MSKKTKQIPQKIAVVLAAWLLLSSTANSAEPQVIVLLNGNILQGRVERAGDRYVVTKGPWYTIRVPASSVDFVARNPREAYEFKLRRLPPNDTRELVRLAQWCLRNDFESLAAETIVRIMRQDPHHSSIEALEQQLLARTKPRKKQPTVKPASHQSPRSTTPSPSDLPPLPPNSVAHFTRAVQPLLINRCGQSACHGNASSNEFRLSRQQNRRIPKVLTWKNLRSVLAQIDTDAPNDSRLLTMALTVHGQAKRSPFEPHETRQLERLRAWILEVSAGNQSGDSRSEQAAWAAAARPVSTAGPAVESGLERLYRASAGDADSADEFDVRGLPGTENEANSQARPDDNAAQTSAASGTSDPFDPAEFNSRSEK